MLLSMGGQVGREMSDLGLVESYFLFHFEFW